MTADAPRARTRRWLWLLFGALAVWLAALVYYTFGVPHAVIHGDPLLDMYLSALSPTGDIQDDTLNKWNSMFPDDPHTTDLSVLEWSSQLKWDDELDYIRDLLKDGYEVSPAVRLIYLRQREAQWNAAAKAYANSPKIDRNHRPPPEVQSQLYVDWECAVCKEVDQAHRAERDKLYADLQQAAPKASIVWYTAANLAFMRGDNARAIDLLGKGNAAPDNTNLQPYPIPLFVHDLRTAGPLSKDVRAANLTGVLVANSLPNFIEMKRMHRSLWDWVVQRNDRNSLNVLHQYACRVATTDDGVFINALVAQMLIGIECTDIQKLGKLTASEQQAVTDLVTKQVKVKGDIRSVTRNNPYQFTSQKPSLLDYLHMNSGGRYSKLELDSEIYEQHELVTKVFPQIEDIARFDFVTMSFKP